MYCVRMFFLRFSAHSRHSVDAEGSDGFALWVTIDRPKILVSSMYGDFD